MWRSLQLNSSIFKNIVFKTNIAHCSVIHQSIGSQQRAVSTVEYANVALFSKEMDDWWKPDGSLTLLHSFNTVRVPFLRDGLAQGDLEYLKDKLILDVGCGGGILSEELAKLGANVTGIDASKDLIDIANKHRSLNSMISKKTSYHNVTVEDHAKQLPEYYDVVVASEVIEFVNNQETFVKSCVQLLKPGGKLFFTAPSKTRMSQFVIIFLCENILKNTLKGIHQYEKFITPKELTLMLEDNKCHVETTTGLLYNPINDKWFLSRYHGIMYALQASKLC